MASEGPPPQLVSTLEAVRHYTELYGLPSGELKSCIACLLDGNLGAAGRHEAAFCIAIELRRMGLGRQRAESVIARWARSIDYAPNNAARAIKSAYAKNGRGEWHYRPPGLAKRGPRYQQVLQPLCEHLDCPRGCLPFSSLYRGQKGEDFIRFDERGWTLHLSRSRQRAAIDVYRAICNLEKARGFAEGSWMFTHYRQLAERAHVNPKTVGRALRRLSELELLEFEVGGGSGPHSNDRWASRVRRVVPIPRPPPRI